MTFEEALQKSAQAWCTEDTESLVMNTYLASAFAHILHSEVNGALEKAAKTVEDYGDLMSVPRHGMAYKIRSLKETE